MRDGTAPAIATGRELSGRRTTEQYLYLLPYHLLAPLHGAGGMRSRSSWARPASRTAQHDGTGHPRTISYASPWPTTPGAKIVRATLRRGAREVSSQF